MKMTLVQLATAAFLFRNDIHYLHHNVEGSGFLEAHDHFGELYERAISDFDFFAENAIVTGEVTRFPNMSNIADLPDSVFSGWNVVHNTESELGIEQAYEYLVANGNDYIEALNMGVEYASDEGFNDVEGKLDEMKEFWNLNVNYKGRRITGKKGD